MGAPRCCSYITKVMFYVSRPFRHSPKQTCVSSQQPTIVLLLGKCVNLWCNTKRRHHARPKCKFVEVTQPDVCLCERSTHPVGRPSCRRFLHRRSWWQNPVCSEAACGAERPDRTRSQQLQTHTHTHALHDHAHDWLCERTHIRLHQNTHLNS